MSNLLQMLQKYKNRKIAIYGLGIETQKILSELNQEFQILGLLDSYREEGVLYDTRIVSLEEMIEHQVELILVVARPGSCKAIARRIGKKCVENHIDLIDVRGRDLCDLKKITYDFKGINGITKCHMMQLIGKNDVVSIDLFDTLIMRQTLFPSDIFELVDGRLKKRELFIEDFCGKRLESEKFLAKSTAPTLVEIYTYMIDTFSILNVSPNELAELEWLIDYELIVPRQEMCELISNVYNQGKEVYVISDTFYTRKQITKLLEKCNIDFYTDVFVSCDYKTSKTQSLFKKLQQRIPQKTCIHIGDDEVADVKGAEKEGIMSCQIFSGIELLDMAGYLGLWDCIEGLSNRIRIGMFVSRLFNSPFQFESEERRISIKSAHDIGYLLFAPIISDFVIWFDRQAMCNNVQNVWFSARDGYLIKKLYDELNRDVASVYFLTSRTAAIRAGVETKDDIRYIEEMQFSGTLREQLWERFGIILNKEEVDGTSADTLLHYSQEILSKAATHRKNYKTYIENLNMGEGEIAFFDFVAKGTSQMYVGRMIKNHLKGFYFLQLEEEQMRGKGLDISPFYKIQEMENSAIFDNYYILETILTSPMPSVKEFDEQGVACYAKETRKKGDIRCSQSVQDGIYDYFKTYLNICQDIEVKVDKRLDELFLALSHGISILDKDFMSLKVEDPFFNRMTDIADLI